MWFLIVKTFFKYFKCLCFLQFQTIPNNRGDNFTDIHLPETTVEIKEKKVPRRILHFSDGTLEEYSTDEEEEEEEDTAPATVIDPVCIIYLSNI